MNKKGLPDSDDRKYVCGSQAIVGFHMTSPKCKLKNYRFYRDFTFTMH